MLLIKLLIAAAIIIVAIVALYRVQKQLKGDVGIKPGTRMKEDRNAPSELEAFIATYRRERAAANLPATTTWEARASFLPAPLKVCFLVLKAAFPDHHVFANTRLSDVLEMHNANPSANQRIDLLLCAKDLRPLAAFDVRDEFEPPRGEDTEKYDRLKLAGIRPFRFASSAIPKPGEMRELLQRQ